MKRFIFIILATISLSVAAQEKSDLDVVYLNNGNIVKGTITEFEPNIAITIVTPDGKTYQYRMIEIREISRNQVIMPKEVNTSKYVHYSEQDKGYWIAVEVSGGASVSYGKSNIGFTQATVVNGYRFSDYLKVGVGAGVRYYIENDNRRIKSNPWVFPVYANLRGGFTSQRVHMLAPYWSIDAGIAIRDGLFISPTLGIKFGGQRSNFLLGVSYLAQQVDTYKIVGNASDFQVKKSDKLISLLALKVGYEF